MKTMDDDDSAHCARLGCSSRTKFLLSIWLQLNWNMTNSWPNHRRKMFLGQRVIWPEFIFIM